jgi:hypothetical protein
MKKKLYTCLLFCGCNTIVLGQVVPMYTYSDIFEDFNLVYPSYDSVSYNYVSAGMKLHVLNNKYYQNKKNKYTLTFIAKDSIIIHQQFSEAGYCVGSGELKINLTQPTKSSILIRNRDNEDSAAFYNKYPLIPIGTWNLYDTNGFKHVGDFDNGKKTGIYTISKYGNVFYEVTYKNDSIIERKRLVFETYDEIVKNLKHHWYQNGMKTGIIQLGLKQNGQYFELELNQDCTFTKKERFSCGFGLTPEIINGSGTWKLSSDLYLELNKIRYKITYLSKDKLVLCEY